MLAPIAGSRNRLMRLYERLGFIPIGANVVVLVTLKAYSTYLSNIDDLMPAKPHMEKHSPYGQKERMEMMGMSRGKVIVIEDGVLSRGASYPIPVFEFLNVNELSMKRMAFEGNRRAPNS